MKNHAGKTRPNDKPYETWQAGDWTWHVLKKYQNPEKEEQNQHARWFCLVVTPMTGALGDLGDTYVRDVTRNAVLTYRDPDYADAQGLPKVLRPGVTQETKNGITITKVQLWVKGAVK